MILLALLLQVSVPPPRGFVNDFAGVLDSASIHHMEAVISEVREKTKGEIAVVTLRDIDGRPVPHEHMARVRNDEDAAPERIENFDQQPLPRLGRL